MKSLLVAASAITVLAISSSSIACEGISHQQDDIQNWRAIEQSTMHKNEHSNAEKNNMMKSKPQILTQSEDIHNWKFKEKVSSGNGNKTSLNHVLFSHNKYAN